MDGWMGEWMDVFGQETHFGCIHLQLLTTIVSYILTLHMDGWMNGSHLGSMRWKLEGLGFT
jgi:hypothetical protein